MVQKRSVDSEDVHGVCYKQPRLAEQCSQMVSFSEDVLPEPGSRSSHSYGDDESNIVSEPPTNPKDIKACAEHDEILGVDTITNPMTPDDDIEPFAAGRISVSSLATSGTSEDDARSYEPFHASHFPAYLSPERPSGRPVNSEDIYSLLLECSPRKPVPVGPNHQAGIPEWNPRGSTSNKLIGTCVIPMEAPTCDGENDGNGRTDCNCEDMGSIRCVRQHITEAREKLIRSVGHEKFMELGFYDMGEQVSKKWSENEEHLFHEVVYTNPASLRTNFWGILSRVFPNRTKKDIVSYYFNVFMLRRRADQNRHDPYNIDSDNDEWHGSRDCGNNELDMSEEDEDSDVESLGYDDDVPHNKKWEDDDEYDKEGTEDTCNNKNRGHGCHGGNNFSETPHWNFPNNCGSDPSVQLQNKVPWDQEILDDSCTSTDTGRASQVTRETVSHANQWPKSFSALDNDGRQEDVLGPCDAKIWDTTYMTCPNHVFDFLPTCNMIEEVFGNGSWNYKPVDGKDSS